MGRFVSSPKPPAGALQERKFPKLGQSRQRGSRCAPHSLELARPLLGHLSGSAGRTHTVPRPQLRGGTGTAAAPGSSGLGTRTGSRHVQQRKYQSRPSVGAKHGGPGEDPAPASGRRPARPGPARARGAHLRARRAKRNLPGLLTRAPGRGVCVRVGA